MSESNYKTLITPQFVKDFRSIYNSVLNNLPEIREELNDDMWCNDIDWSVIEYFIYDLTDVVEHLEKTK
jgi:hypothetical protein